MTADVIQFPMHKRIANSKHTVAGVPVNPPKDGFDYLLLCKEFLEIDDYIDILAAILDPVHYDGLEEQLKNIVDCYYELEQISRG